MKEIRVLLADDHAVLRAGLRMLIDAQPDMAVVAEAGDGDEAIRRVSTVPTDVAVVDLAMPGIGGIETIRRLREQAPDTRVLVLTMHDDPAYPRVALAAGASGYVTKDVDGPDVLSAIRAVARGRTYVQCGVTMARDDAAPGGLLPAESAPSARPSLSARERQVLELLARGYTNRQAAERLFLSVKTVETYRARLGEKLGLRTRSDLVRFALSLGLLSADRDGDGEPT